MSCQGVVIEADERIIFFPLVDDMNAIKVICNTLTPLPYFLDPVFTNSLFVMYVSLHFMNTFSEKHNNPSS